MSSKVMLSWRFAHAFYSTSVTECIEGLPTLNLRTAANILCGNAPLFYQFSGSVAAETDSFVTSLTSRLSRINSTFLIYLHFIHNLLLLQNFRDGFNVIYTDYSRLQLGVNIHFLSYSHCLKCY